MSSRSSTVTSPPPQAATSRRFVRRVYATSAGEKAVMAVTGAVLVLYLVAHMVGTLKVFMGRHPYDRYASWLRSMGEPALPHRTVLTAIEVVLAVAVTLHLWSAVSLTRRAHRARPVRYAARPRARENRYATHVMRYGGVVIALFVVWHLLDLTFGTTNPAGAGADPYDKVVADFAPAHWYVTVFYAVAVIMVGLHLRHGLWSAFQTLGWGRRSRYPGLRLFADTTAAVLVLGFLSVPVLVTIGVVS